MDLQSAKQRMLLHDLRDRGIVDRRVLAAMDRVPRERFVAAETLDAAYADRALGIGFGQTISQPYIVGLMTQALDLAGGERVLEIGTGSGYQAAVLAELGAEVVSIERHEELSRRAGLMLAETGYRRVTLVVGDGSLGHPAGAPYDRILVTAAAAAAPPALFDQLAEAGILVIPLGNREHQVLQAIHKVSGAPVSTSLTACRFVPLVGVQGWPDKPG